MKLEIVLRTHDSKNIHGDKPRYIDIPKRELVIGCVSSLVNSANLVDNNSISFTVLDDHSSEELILSLYQIFEHSKHPYQIKNLQERGFNHSGYMQFLTCRNSDADLVYSVEDDYLHHVHAIPEMLDTYKYLKNYYKIEKDICLFPFDNPEDYLPDQLFPGRIFKTPFRYWKEGVWTTFTMMTTPKIFQDYWNIFEKLALEYKPWDGVSDIDEFVHEGNTISEIWKNHAVRVNPIPSLALHLQFEEQRNTHIDHIDWWDKYSKIKN